MNTWFIGCFSQKIKLSLSQKRLFVSWICWCCNYAFFLSRMLHLRAFLSRMSWLRAFWRWILRRIFGRNPQKYAEFWQKICGKSWPLEPLLVILSPRQPVWHKGANMSRYPWPSFSDPSLLPSPTIFLLSFIIFNRLSRIKHTTLIIHHLIFLDVFQYKDKDKDVELRIGGGMLGGEVMGWEVHVV